MPMAGYAFANTQAKGKAVFGIRPEHVVAGKAAKIMPFNHDVEFEIVKPMGSEVLVWSRHAGREFRFRVDGQNEFSLGQKVLIGFDPARASLFNAASELRL